ncbi:hypothetical protein P3T76_009560 [Phytophthora citrophthora]|uniref:Uncharacterized protein n=1 Tax=Phytophthora citrophthora TaxID=4793 RepID=A0AAD9LIE2_9STRA|nr:hypothetical protein P3T76_009560 [Phytophthora citrophthora]
MRIFLPAGYDVTGTGDDAKARLLRAGRDAESNILEFLTAENIKARAHGTVVKTLKRLHGAGKLDDRILQFQRLQQEGKVLDDSPVKSVRVLSPCGGNTV